jgi:hypothetical protein
MARPTGTADLPLHGGRVPPWLAERMARLGRVMVEALLLLDGHRGVLERLAHPFWFQSLGCVMGMDWHSSGITTSTLGALKRGLRGAEAELGLWVCGGRGQTSRRTPDELTRMAEHTGLDGAKLIRTSRLVARVDNNAVQDGFQIYLHGFVVARDGDWTVVQQGLSGPRGTARRYHWTRRAITSFVDRPHAAIDGEDQGLIVNLTDPRARRARDAIGTVLREGLTAFLDHVRELRRHQPRLALPDRHSVRPSDVIPHRLAAAFEAGAQASDFEELVLTPGLGARTLGSLALIAETIHGRPVRFRDPARFSFAHGGKDGHPFPVQTRVYDETLRVLRRAVERARLGRDEQMQALRRLDAQARRLEAVLAQPDSGVGPHTVEWIMQRERRRSPELGGRVSGRPTGQLSLFRQAGRSPRSR